MQGGTYPSIDWSATALLNGFRYLVASLLFGVLGFFLSSELSRPERLAQGLSMAVAFGFLYALDVVLLLSLGWKYDRQCYPIVRGQRV
jgi:ABC-type transport system involved in multi-copper enzyme maturation permease subunit